MDLQNWFAKNQRQIFGLIVAVFVGLVAASILTWPDGKLRVVFCDVGQGDAIYIKLPSGKDMLVDGGPDSKVLQCLSQNMPFYDRTIDILVSTHPEADHLTGLIEVLRRYKINLVINNNIKHNTSEYNTWVEELARRKPKQSELKRGDILRFDTKIQAEILWPQTQRLKDWQKNGTDNFNQTSVVLRLTYQDFCALLTGDIGLEAKSFVATKPCLVLKVPHHGSRFNLDAEFIDKVAPQIAVISAGKNNRYGHPHEEVMKILQDKPASPAGGDIKILRTDEKGTIKIVSDGKTYQIN